jgi:hypothetical protein
VNVDLKQAIADEYDRGAPAYATYAEPLVFRRAVAPLARALADVEGPILDVATGTGSLAGQLPDAVGLDLSFGQLRENGLGRRVQADAERLPFRDDAFAAAASAFGANHWPRPAAGVAEMARVAPVVGLLMWVRPEAAHVPKQVVLDALVEHAGRARSDLGDRLDGMTQAVGSEDAIRELLEAAGLDACVSTITVEIPWPGAEAFVGYRLAMVNARALVPDLDAFLRDVVARLNALPARDLDWRPELVLGLGRRTRP